MSNALNRIGWIMLLGTALAVTPALSTNGSFLSYDQAKAEKGGNGGGGGNRGGNSGGNRSDGGSKSNAKSDNGGKSNKSSSASTKAKSSNSKASSAKAASPKVTVASTEEETVEEPKNTKGKISSKLGALNAAHASATAFANASIDSRIGKIRAYYEASQALAGLQEEAAKLTQEATDLRNELNTDVLTAYEAALKDPTLEQDYLNALADAGITQDEFEADYQAWADKVDEAEAKTAEAEVAETNVQGLLDAAANKPVDDDVLEALDKLMEGKLPPEPTETTPDETTETTPETPTETTADTSGGEVTDDLPIIN